MDRQRRCVLLPGVRDERWCGDLLGGNEITSPESVSGVAEPTRDRERAVAGQCFSEILFLQLPYQSDDQANTPNAARQGAILSGETSHRRRLYVEVDWP